MIPRYNNFVSYPGSCQKTFVQRLYFAKKGLLRKITAPSTKLSKFYSSPGAKESVRLLKSVGRLRFLDLASTHEVHSSGLFREIGDFPNMRKHIPSSTPCSGASQLYPVYLVNLFQGFYTLLPCRA